MIKSILIAFIILAIVILAGLVLRINMKDMTGYSVKEIELTTDCLKNKAVLYGNNNYNTQLQLSIFGSYKNKITFIDCSKTTCNKATFPTWIINNKEYQGVYSLKKLKELSNC